MYQVLKDAPQGSPAWHAARAQHFCASEAAAALDVSKYTTRDELLRQKATGLTEEVSPAKQRIFDAGHEAEKLAGPIAEGIAGVEFAPLVGTREVDGLKLLASFDGIDVDDEVIWENKLLNQSLVQQVHAGDLEPHYWAQLEQQLLVSGAKRALFTTSDGTPDGTHHLWYESVPERRAKLIAGWKQFAIDLAAWQQPAVAAPAATGKAPASLPALLIEVKGEVTASNLAEFREVALTAIRSVNRDLKTDQDFADSAKARKWCEDIEAGAALAKDRALTQTVSIKELFDALDEISAEAGEVRRALLTIEKARTAAINGELVADGIAKFSAHIDKLNATMPAPYMPKIAADFGGALRNLRSVSSKQNAINTALANAKIEADEVARRIQANLRVLAEKPDLAFLFNDVATIVLKANDDFAVLVKSRIAEHEAKEAAHLEAERERIRAEEQAKAQREAREAEAQRERERQEELRQQMLQKEREDQSAIAAAAASQQIAAPLADDLSALAREKTQEAVAGIDAAQVINTAQRAAAAAPVVDTESATLLIGGINRRLGYDVNAVFLKQLGFEPVRIDGARRFYRDSDLPLIGRAIAQHTLRVTQLQPA